MSKLKSTDSTERMLSFEASDMVTLVIGKERVEWRAHRKQLAASPFFAAAFQKWHKEGQSGIIELPRDRPETIQYYLHYLYAQEIHRDQSIRLETYYCQLAEFYVFGEKVLDVKFKTAIISKFVELIKEEDEEGESAYPIGKPASIIFEGTMAGSMARKLILDIYYHHSEPFWFHEHECPVELLRAIVWKKAAVNAGDEVDEGLELALEDYLEIEVKK